MERFTEVDAKVASASLSSAADVLSGVGRGSPLGPAVAVDLAWSLKPGWGKVGLWRAVGACPLLRWIFT